MAKRVLLLINTLQFGGTERNVAAFCRHMNRGRFEPQIGVLFGGGEFEADVRAAGVPVRCLSERGRRKSLWNAASIARRIAAADVDLIHAFLPAVAGYTALGQLWRKKRVPLVLSVGTTALVKRRDEWAYRRCYTRIFDRVIANSPAVQQYVVSLGFSADRISIVPNGHETAAYDLPFDRDAVRASLGAAPHDHLALFVGRFIPTKRVCDLVEAVARLAPRFPRLRVALVGEGALRDEVERQIANANLSSTFTLAGRRSDIPEVLRAADSFVFPSEVEGLPNSIIEACLARVPIVACDIPGTRSVLNESQAALVPPRDIGAFAAALQSVIESPQEAALRAQRARDAALSGYSLTQSLSKLYAVYDELMDSRSPHRSASRPADGANDPSAVSDDSSPSSGDRIDSKGVSFAAPTTTAHEP